MTNDIRSAQVPPQRLTSLLSGIGALRGELVSASPAEAGL